jgi:hypothetical protein
MKMVVVSEEGGWMGGVEMKEVVRESGSQAIRQSGSQAVNRQTTIPVSSAIRDGFSECRSRAAFLSNCAA